MIGELEPGAARDMLCSQPAALLLDVRTRMEFDYVGHPPGALNVPWQEFPDWRVDPDFVAHVAAGVRALRPGQAPEDVPLLLLCRTGKRSGAAAQALDAAGYRHVFNIREGFEGERDAHGHRNTINGWRQRGLPWEQS